MSAGSWRVSQELLGSPVEELLLAYERVDDDRRVLNWRTQYAAWTALRAAGAKLDEPSYPETRRSQRP